jgi:hypothetical protein
MKLSPLQMLSLGLLVITAFSLGLNLRLDSLRSYWKGEATTWRGKAEGITVTIRDVTNNPRLTVDQAPQAVRDLGAERDRIRDEREAAKGVIIRQGETIRASAAEVERLRKMSNEQRAQIIAIMKQRDHWIRQAEGAATRTQRLSAEAEIQICEEAMNALYQAGF